VSLCGLAIDDLPVALRLVGARFAEATVLRASRARGRSPARPCVPDLRSPLAVHILTGFLGSGKTTLLSRLLRDPALADTAVVINELGEVGLDHLLVDRGSEEGVVLLDSGCLCCALGNSLQETLESLHYRRQRGELPAFARVVVETTGVADPGPIAATLSADSAIARHYRLGSIVTVVDAVHGGEQLERFEEARRQVAVADRLVVSKGDLADATAIARLDAKLAARNPHAARLAAVDGVVAADSVIVDAPDPQALRQLALAEGAAARGDGGAVHAHGAVVGAAAGDSHDHLDEHGIASTTLRLAAPLDWPRYADWVQWMQRAFGGGLLRMKGAVRMADGDVRALHAVMQLFSAPRELPGLPPELGNGVIVLITQDVAPSLLDEARRRLSSA
jgi:G3E family GTPase